MRPNRIGWGIALFFLVAGGVLTVIAPDIWLGQVYIGCAFALTALYVVMLRRADRVDRRIHEGVRGDAEILSAEQTGGYVNGQPRVRLRLRVQSPDGETRELEHTYTVPLTAVGRLESGGTLPIYFDRGNSSKFSIDWSGGGREASAADRLRELGDLREAGLVDAVEYDRQRERILGAI